MLITGERIKQLRNQAKQSQEELAIALGVKRETIKFWESGGRHIKDVDIIKLADFYRVTSDYLLGISDTPTPDCQLRDKVKQLEDKLKSAKQLNDEIKSILSSK